MSDSGAKTVFVSFTILCHYKSLQFGKRPKKDLKIAHGPPRVKWWGPKHLGPSYFCELSLPKKCLSILLQQGFNSKKWNYE